MANQKKLLNKKVNGNKTHTCGICLKGINHNSKSVCCDHCEECVHIKCGKITLAEYSNILNDSSWKCPKCVATTKGQTSTSTILVNDIVNEVQSFAPVDEKINFIIQQLTTMNTKIGTYTTAMENLTQKYDEVMNTVSKLEKIMNTQNEKLLVQERKIEQLSIITNRYEQSELANKLILKGVPFKNVQNVQQTVDTIIKKCVPTFNSQHIIKVQVMKLKGENIQTAPIVIEFNSSSARNLILKEKRVLRQHNETKNIYFDEMLTTETSKLFTNARELKRKFKFKQVFAYNGRVLARELENGGLIWIRNEKHLENIIHDTVTRRKK